MAGPWGCDYNVYCIQMACILPPRYLLQKQKIRIDDHRTLRERILFTIRAAIVNGQIPPGTRIMEPELAERFGISRTPIREAIRQLESEGLISVIPRRGAIVASISPQDIANFYELKMILEGHAARLAAKNLTENDLTKMETVNRQIEAASAKKNLSRVLDLHNEFHEIFLRACGNDILHAIVQNLVKQFQRFRLIPVMPGKIKGSVRQHVEIIEAFRRKDAARAEKLVRKNALYGKNLLLRELTKVWPSPTAH
jgi:DNA-binding GntR family transcriptional regulator